MLWKRTRNCKQAHLLGVYEHFEQLFDILAFKLPALIQLTC